MPGYAMPFHINVVNANGLPNFIKQFLDTAILLLIIDEYRGYHTYEQDHQICHN